MLSPDDRTLLVDLLAPPGPGFRLERAVATTFTLHLTALLPVPLGFAGLDLSSSADPLSVLQAVHNYADRIDVFCQSGHVAVPAQRNDLLAFLEGMVHQVRAPSPGHLFHPKLWALRFVGAGEAEVFRLVCGSRNLTHDRAWDTVITLEGSGTRRPRAVNKPLADFIASLPGRVPAGIDQRRAMAIHDMAEAIRSVEWDRPSDVLEKEWLAFHVLGAGRRRQPPNLDGYRRLIIAPFMNEGGLEAVWPNGDGECTVVSRAEEMNAIHGEWRALLGERAALRVLDEGAAIPEAESHEAGLRWSLSGLHAKAYLVERNKRAHVFIGSANATGAAWGGNDELLVEIVGRPSIYGVDATLNAAGRGKGNGGLGRILLPHELGEATEVSAEEELRRSLEDALRQLAALTYTATVEGDRETPLLWVRSTEPLELGAAVPSNASLTVELLTVPAAAHKPATGVRLDTRWQLEHVEDITPFLVMRLASGTGAASVEVSSIVLARLVGDPPDRLDRVLARRIGTPGEFLRFVLLLLQLAGEEGWIPESQQEGLFGSFAVGEDGAGLLEAVVGALASTPGVLDDVDRLVKRLSCTEEGRAVLPEGWVDFWPAVMEARSRLERNGR
jgi:hypothetical protein